jgi:hypothetical protein
MAARISAWICSGVAAVEVGSILWSSANTSLFAASIWSLFMNVMGHVVDIIRPFLCAARPLFLVPHMVGYRLVNEGVASSASDSQWAQLYLPTSRRRVSNTTPQGNPSCQIVFSTRTVSMCCLVVLFQLVATPSCCCSPVLPLFLRGRC